MTKKDERFEIIHSDCHDIRGEGSKLAEIRKVLDTPDGRSNQGEFIGRREQLLDYDAVSNLRDYNVHHSTCLDAKQKAAVGLGHRDQDVTSALDPLCEINWKTTLDSVINDYFEHGNGYLEVVRNDAGQIAGLHHIRARDVWVFVEDRADAYHYEIASRGTFDISSSLLGLRFARFGDKDAFFARRNIETSKRKLVSEVIPFQMNLGRRSRYYGYADWIAATPAMELDQCVTQYSFDFFFNGAAPDAIVAITGGSLDTEAMDELKKKFQNVQGIGKRRKVILMNLEGQEMELQVEKMALDGQTVGDFVDLLNDQEMKIVSAHRTPPLLAGIQVSGKLGAANEMSNSLALFQATYVAPHQVSISAILAQTLGHPVHGVKGLTADDFRGVGAGDPEPDPTKPPDPLTGMPALRPKDNQGNGFRTILDVIDLGTMDTVGRMRTSVAEASARGRDISQGVAERGGDVEAKRGERS